MSLPVSNYRLADTAYKDQTDDGETVILNIVDEHFYRLTPTASAILERLLLLPVQHPNLSDVVKFFNGTVSEDQVQLDAELLASELAKLGLIVENN